jgi:hypothetical protein
MPLDLYWRIESKTKTKTLIERMRQRALDLPFIAVGEVVRLVGEETHITDEDDDPWHCLKLMAHDWLWTDDDEPWLCPPNEIVGFQIEVAPGCDPAAIYFACYPTGMLTENGVWLPTTRPTWSGQAQCDTQFASHPDCGGVANFVRAHGALCRLLDYAKELGILAYITDEGFFFDDRNVSALVTRINDYNAYTAAFVGAWKDSGRRSTSPILTYPNFEHLEAKGLEKAAGDLEWLKKTEPEGE